MASKVSLDRRIIRTRHVIRTALVELIDEKGFDALTVRDIATRADINRGTFYLHYRDKFDLLDQTEAELIRDFENIIIQANSLDLSDFNSIDKPLPVVVSMFEYIKENAALMHSILTIEGDFAFQKQIRKAVEHNLKIGFLSNIRAENFLVPSDYLLSYVISANFGVIQYWLQKGCVESPKEMALILSRISLEGPIRVTGVGVA